MKKLMTLAMMLILTLTMAACSQNGDAGKNADLPKTLETMKTEVGFNDVVELDMDGLKTNYGIDGEDVKQFAALVDASGIKCEEVVLIEAKDADAAKTVKEQLDKRMESKLAQNKDYLPEQYAIIKKCSVEQNGNYVSMIVGEQHEKLTEIYHNAFA